MTDSENTTRRRGREATSSYIRTEKSGKERIKMKEKQGVVDRNCFVTDAVSFMNQNSVVLRDVSPSPSCQVLGEKVRDRR